MRGSITGEVCVMASGGIDAPGIRVVHGLG